MLQHDPEPSQSASDAAQTRVKVDVLAKAIAAIEERRQEQARQMEGTALVGDVVHDLQLDVTPEELLAEVEAQRQAAAAPWNKPALEIAYAGRGTRERNEEDSRAFRKSFIIGAALTPAVMLVIWYIASISSSDPLHYRPGYKSPAPTYTPPVSQPMPPRIPPPTSIPFGMAPAQFVDPRTVPVHTLASIANGHPFGCSINTLQLLLQHEPLSNIMLYDAERDMTYDMRKPSTEQSYPDPNHFPIGPFAKSSWTLIKYNGKVYLRCWAEQDMVQQIGSGKIVLLRNGEAPADDGLRFKPITLPLATVTTEGGYPQNMNIPDDVPHAFPNETLRARRLAQYLLVRGLKPDSHTWEKWTP